VHVLDSYGLVVKGVRSVHHRQANVQSAWAVHPHVKAPVRLTLCYFQQRIHWCESITRHILYLYEMLR